METPNKELLVKGLRILIFRGLYNFLINIAFISKVNIECTCGVKQEVPCILIQLLKGLLNCMQGRNN